MKHGDFIITANWAPHDHGNPGKQPVMWLDVLDMPTVNHFETSFAEHFDEKMQKTNHADGNSFERYASGVLPDGAPAHSQPQPGDQLSLRQDAADPRAPEETPATSTSVTARACAMPTRSMAGRCCRLWALTSRCCRRASRASPTARPTATIFAVAEGQRHHHHRRQADRMERQRRVRGAAVEALFAQRYQRATPCCSRFPIGRRRKRSASGGKGTERPRLISIAAARLRRSRLFLPTSGR